MPWLEKAKDHAAVQDQNHDPSNSNKQLHPDQLLFVHVPRCGGTSLVKHFRVEEKCRKGLNPYYQLGLIYFFYRYRCLEKENFPFRTWENLLSLISFLIAWIVYFAMPEWGIAACEDDSIYCPPPVSVSLWTTSIFFFILNTFVMNAPVMGRVDLVRRFEMWVFSYLLCGFGSTEPYLHGVNINGYLMHYTATKMVSHEFVKEDELVAAHTFAIVRNPYSRMVSIYMYNRFGSCESFDHFVDVWYAKWEHYKKVDSTEENVVYCHVLPQKEFTHRDDEQLVPYIVRQEDLKYLTGMGEVKDPFYRERYKVLAPEVLSALKGMPHSNKRVRKQPWQDYYTDRTIRLVYKMYAMDFEEFKYSTTITNSEGKKLKPEVVREPSKFAFRASSRHLLAHERDRDIESGGTQGQPAKS